MKKSIIKILLVILILITAPLKSFAADYNILVLPTDIFNICDNYFCFPEPSEIAATYVINDLNNYKSVNLIDLSEIRAKLEKNENLKDKTIELLKDFEQTEKINFNTLTELSELFGTKSTIIISSYAITDRSATRRNLWEVLEVSSAFRITYPFNLTTTAVLTDNVNSVVMWSNKYNKTVSDSNGYFLALNHAQAASHLEKIKQYYRNNVSKNISQNVHLRFFPKDVKTFKIKGNNEHKEESTFVPNALEHLAKPIFTQHENDYQSESYSTDDFIFEY